MASLFAAMIRRVFQPPLVLKGSAEDVKINGGSVAFLLTKWTPSNSTDLQVRLPKVIPTYINAYREPPHFDGFDVEVTGRMVTWGTHKGYLKARKVYIPKQDYTIIGINGWLIAGIVLLVVLIAIPIIRHFLRTPPVPPPPIT